jgi:uncharacterized protein
MTQAAKVQEPSMEEILASIRRIIADDEAKPPVAEKPTAPVTTAKPEKPVAAAPAPAKASAPASKPAAPVIPPPAPAVSNGQDDIDALLNGLDEATSPDEVRSPAAEPEVFDLTDDMAVAPPQSPSPLPTFQKVELQDDVEFAETAATRALHRQPSFEPPALESGSATQQILSRSTISAVESAFNSLAHTVLSNNARTLEDLVKEMLRPMLKSWLDDNLPGLVERIVKAEIERVSRGR